MNTFKPFNHFAPFKRFAPFKPSKKRFKVYLSYLPVRKSFPKRFERFEPSAAVERFELLHSTTLEHVHHIKSGKPAITATVITAVNAVKCQYSATL